MGGTEEVRVGSNAARLGFTAGQVVQEFGYGDDVDEDLRAGIEELIGGELVDEDYDDIVDGVVLWWRDGDGDLTDDLVDTASLLEDGGFVVLLTPGKGRPDRVEAFDVQEACTASGLTASGGVPVGEWVAQRLVGRR